MVDVTLCKRACRQGRAPTGCAQPSRPRTRRHPTGPPRLAALQRLRPAAPAGGGGGARDGAHAAQVGPPGCLLAPLLAAPAPSHLVSPSRPALGACAKSTCLFAAKWQCSQLACLSCFGSDACPNLPAAGQAGRRRGVPHRRGRRRPDGTRHPAQGHAAQVRHTRAMPLALHRPSPLPHHALSTSLGRTPNLRPGPPPTHPAPNAHHSPTSLPLGWTALPFPLQDLQGVRGGAGAGSQARGAATRRGAGQGERPLLLHRCISAPPSEPFALRRRIAHALLGRIAGRGLCRLWAHSLLPQRPVSALSRAAPCAPRPLPADWGAP